MNASDLQVGDDGLIESICDPERIEAKGLLPVKPGDKIAQCVVCKQGVQPAVPVIAAKLMQPGLVFGYYMLDNDEINHSIL